MRRHVSSAGNPARPGSRESDYRRSAASMESKEVACSLARRQPHPAREPCKSPDVRTGGTRSSSTLVPPTTRKSSLCWSPKHGSSSTPGNSPSTSTPLRAQVSVCKATPEKNPAHSQRKLRRAEQLRRDHANQVTQRQDLTPLPWQSARLSYTLKPLVSARRIFRCSQSRSSFPAPTGHGRSGDHPSITVITSPKYGEQDDGRDHPA